MRYADEPKHKESVCSQMFGELIGMVESLGLTKGKEYETAVKPLFDCSTKVLWLDQVSDELQLTVVIRSLHCNVEYGLVRKSDKKVLVKKKTDDFRYNVSQGTEIQLIDSHITVFKDFVREIKEVLENQLMAG